MAQKKKKLSENILRGLSAGSTYRLNTEVALELEVYSQVGLHGPKKRIMEEALSEWFKKNPIRPRVRQAALLILEERGQE